MLYDRVPLVHQLDNLSRVMAPKKYWMWLDMQPGTPLRLYLGANVQRLVLVMDGEDQRDAAQRIFDATGIEIQGKGISLSLQGPGRLATPLDVLRQLRWQDGDPIEFYFFPEIGGLVLACPITRDSEFRTQLDWGDYTSLRSIARECHAKIEAVVTILAKNQFPIVSAKTPEDQGYPLAIPRSMREEAKSIIRAEYGNRKEKVWSTNKIGLFYLILLKPEHLPNLVKLGFTTDMPARMASIQNTNPTAVVVKTWRCRQEFEKYAISLMTNNNGSRVGDNATEVYFLRDIELAIRKADWVFREIPLSSGSPPDSLIRQRKSWRKRCSPVKYPRLNFGVRSVCRLSRGGISRSWGSC